MPDSPSRKPLSQQAVDSAALLDRLADAMAADDGPRVFVQDSVPDKYSFGATAAIDCENRVALCKGACCRLVFALSQQDIDEGVVAWDGQQPYLNAQDPEGYCVHLERGACRCSIYDKRPAPCRAFDCRNDKRIWLDFEGRVPNPALEELEWPRNLGSEFDPYIQPAAPSGGARPEEAATHPDGQDR